MTMIFFEESPMNLAWVPTIFSDTTFDNPFSSFSNETNISLQTIFQKGYDCSYKCWFLYFYYFTIGGLNCI